MPNANKKIIGEPIILNGKQLPISKAVRASGDMIFLSGQIPWQDGKAMGETMEDQTRFVLNSIRDILKEAGAEMRHVVETMCILTDIADFAAFNKVYTEFFPDHPPARTTLVAALVVPVKVEITARAVMPA